MEEYENWSTQNFGVLEEKAIASKWGGHKWWSMFGAEWPLLKELATIMLAQTSSVGAAERGWSCYGDVKTRKRNGLSASTADKLTRILYNKRNTSTTHVVAGYWELDEVVLGDDSVDGIEG